MSESQCPGLPACSMSLLQVHLFLLSGNHEPEDCQGSHAPCTQLIISSLPVGRGRALLWPFALPRHTEAWVQGRAPPGREPWADVRQAERGLLPLPTSVCCQGHPPSHQETSRHQPGQSSRGLGMVPVCLRWLPIQLGEVGGMRRERGRQRGDGLCCGSSSGPVAQLERACRLRSTGQGSLCPLSLVAPPLPPLHLLDRLHPCFSSMRRHIRQLCV